MTSILARIFSRTKKRTSSSGSGTEEAPPCLNINDVLKDRFVIKSIIGFGSFGEIYKVYDRKLSIHAALKSELKSTKREKRREQLPVELAVLKCMQGDSRVP
uniref:Protein kinase domain-containing protein n=1 Tax=Romanomermis culicivorax TaxID=13658 RepID=A0A915I487_ROMCU